MKVVIFLVVCSFFAYGEIYEIDRFDQARVYLEEADEDTIVVFDVDGVLSLPKDPCFCLKSFDKYSEELGPIFESLSMKERDYFIGLLACASGDVLVEEGIVGLICDVQKKKAKVVALTAIPSGKIDVISNMTVWRQERLLTYGIDFSSSFKENGPIFFDEFPKHLGGYPTFYKGVITANGIGVTTKGEVFLSFLNRVKFHPKKVIFFDDHINHVKSLEKALLELSPSVKYVGFHYKGASMIESFVSKQETVSKIKKLVEKAHCSSR